MSDKLRILVVDQSSLLRKTLSVVASECPEVEVIGTAPNGKIGLEKILRLKPDMVLLEAELPDADGFAVLAKALKDLPNLLAVMTGSNVSEGAECTIKLIKSGAFDCIHKSKNRPDELKKQLKNEFDRVYKHYLQEKKSLKIEKEKQKDSAGDPCSKDISSRMKILAGKPQIGIVAIGVSTGGPQALGEIIPKLPKDLKVPVVIVQHMPAQFTVELADSLNKRSALKVVEGHDGQILSAGTVYIAPGGKQMKLCKNGSAGSVMILVTDDPPENNCKPAADYLFRSVAKVYKDRALGVILTGMGGDGAKGLKVMKKYDVTVIAQDEKTCIVFGMPAEAIKAGVVDIVVPLGAIAGKIAETVAG